MEGFDDVGAMLRARALSEELEESLRHMRFGQDLADDASFQTLVSLLANHADATQRLRWLVESPGNMRCAAIAAMIRVGDSSHWQVASLLDRVGYFAMHFAFEYLDQLTDPELLGRVLLRMPPYLWEYPSTRKQFFDYLHHMHIAGVTPALAVDDVRLDWNLEQRRDALVEFDVPMVREFVKHLEQLDRRRRDSVAYTDFAYIPIMCHRLDQIHDVLTSSARPCLVLAGDAGVGRTTLARAALRTLAGEGWTVVEASPHELLAELQHVHPIEERVNTLVAGLSGERQIWHATCWFQLLDPPSDECHAPLLELLWPYVQSGELQIVGSVSWHNARRATEDFEYFSSVFRTIDIAPLARDDTVALSRDWAVRQSDALGVSVMDETMLEAVVDLCERALPRLAEPGRTLGTLQDALDVALLNTPGSLPLGRADILSALERRTGLSRALFAGP